MTRTHQDIRNAIDTTLSGASHDPTLFNRVVNASKGDSPPVKRKLTLSMALVLVLALAAAAVAARPLLRRWLALPRRTRLAVLCAGGAAALVLAVVLKADYGWKGVLLMMLLYAARGSRKTIAAVMIAFCLFWGNGSVRNEIFGISLAPLTARTNPLSGIFTTLLQLQSLALLALPLMIWPDEVRIPIPTALQAKAQRTHLCIPTRMPSFRMPAWLGYAIYPAHLLLLIALKYQLDKPLRWEYLTQAWEQFIALF